MEISNMQFDFSPLGRNRKNQRRTAVDGMTMTVYDSRFNVTKDVLEALDNPEKISISYNDQLASFLIFADENGQNVARKSSGGKTFRVGDVKTILQQKGCDFFANFYRIENGRRYGRFVLFALEDLIEVKREVRNGIN